MKKKQKKLLALLWLAFLAGAGFTWLVTVKVHCPKSWVAQIEYYADRIFPDKVVPSSIPADSAVPDIPVVPKQEEIPSAETGKPKIAIIIDDMGLNPSLSMQAVRLPAFVTLAYLPYAPQVQAQADRAREAGHELLLHMPMEPMGSANPGKGALFVNLSPDEIRARMLRALASFTGYDGVNNHMGSRFTTDPAKMGVVMTILKEKGLIFIDSRTNAETVGEQKAREHGVLTASRHVFLDNDNTPEAIKAQLAQTVMLARRNGEAIAIGHPHPSVLKALEGWLLEAKNQGVELVPVCALVH